jgi:hypothetical protein
MRMQRDLQRVGEVCGVAAALAVESGCEAAQVPYDTLRPALEETGALVLRRDATNRFGSEMTASGFADPYDGVAGQALVTRLAGDLGGEKWGSALWRLHLLGPEEAGTAARDLLGSPDPNRSWQGALLWAGWEDPVAEPRLIAAVESMEQGEEYSTETRGTRPRWWVAAALLRTCGTPACFPTLRELAERPGLRLNTGIALALTVARVASRSEVRGDDRRTAEGVLEALLSGEPAHVVTAVARDPITGATRPPSWLEVEPRVVEDFGWQLHLAVARARRALGLPAHPEAERFLADERALVRKAFAAALRGQ